MSTLDSNSSRTVSSNLRVWLHWCRTNSIDPITGDLNSICEFFSDKLNKNRAFNTIAGYRSAISEIHNHIDGYTVGQHPDVTQAMSAVRKENPPPVPSDDLIDISPSLEYIVNLGDNESMQIRDLSMKTAFLLALVTASRPSDLHRIDITTITRSSYGCRFQCIDPKEYKIAIAHSSSTTKKRTKSLFVGPYEENVNLCPLSAVHSLINRTAQWRITSTTKKALFLISRDPHNPAAVDTIANWIKELMQRSSITSSAKDVRSISASLAQNAGADITSVLALGNWTSNSTFQRFYQRGIKLMIEKNKVSELIINEASRNSNAVHVADV